MGGPDKGEEHLPTYWEEQKLGKKERRVSGEDYIPIETHSARCVDDRPDRTGENRGVQLPGGSLHILDLMRVAILMSGQNIEEEALWQMTDTALRSQEARKNNIVPGVHIDDNHGHLTSDAELAVRERGCGYDAVRGEVLGRLGVEIGIYQPGENIRRARAMGWGVQQLAGDHSGEATAALNFLPGLTLRTQRLWEEDRVPSFNHDIWAVRMLLPAMLHQLEEGGFQEASQLLAKDGVNWSKKVYVETLDILSEGRIGVHDLIEIS